MQEVQEAGARLLMSVVGALATYYPASQFGPPSYAGLSIALPCVEPWVDKYGQPLDYRPEWHIPDEAEVWTDRQISAGCARARGSSYANGMDR
jgi:hypothetical protein